MSAPRLTDRQRIELAIPARLTFGLVAANCFGPDPNADPEEAAAELERSRARLADLLTEACLEPLVGLMPKDEIKIARRIERTVDAIARPYDGQPAIKLALVLFYFLSDLVEREVLELWEGSAFGEAWKLLEPMFAHGFEEERLDKSAQKQARKLLESLKREGLYSGGWQPIATAPAGREIPVWWKGKDEDDSFRGVALRDEETGVWYSGEDEIGAPDYWHPFLKIERRIAA